MSVAKAFGRVHLVAPVAVLIMATACMPDDDVHAVLRQSGYEYSPMCPAPDALPQEFDRLSASWAPISLRLPPGTRTLQGSEDFLVEPEDFPLESWESPEGILVTSLILSELYDPFPLIESGAEDHLLCLGVVGEVHQCLLGRVRWVLPVASGAPVVLAQGRRRSQPGFGCRLMRTQRQCRWGDAEQGMYPLNMP
jgi:hypothetical protein